MVEAAARERGRVAEGLPPEEEYPEPDAGDGPASALPRRIEAWRKRSATGAILTGFAFGLREALENEQKEPAITLQTSGVPPRDLAAEADLEDPLPKRNVVRVRPWLMDGDEPDGGSERGDAAGEDDPDVTADTDLTEDRDATGDVPGEVSAPEEGSGLRTAIPARDPKRRPRKRRR